MTKRVDVKEHYDGWDIFVFEDGETTVFRWSIDGICPGKKIADAFEKAGIPATYEEVY